MVDSEARREAADLVRKFRDGEISNFSFEDEWPRYDKRDLGLRAIATMLWRSYDDLREHTLKEERHLLSPEGRDIFDRCILFLRSDLEYQWPRTNFIGVGGLGILGRIFTLGLSIFVDRAMQRREERRLRAIRILGNDAVWPFFTTEEYALHRHTERV